jgi:tRNA (adenine57-N1/adenine58-N1)-methyltransferase catalytic subunit
MAKDAVQPGDVVALVDEKGQRFLLTVPTHGNPEVTRIRGVGVIDTAKLAGHPWAAPLAHGSKTFRVMPPGTVDLVQGLHRKAAIVQPKDAARILLECDVRAGSLVVESGIGSGALTVTLARAVAPTGRVVTIEYRQDFLDWARRNLEAAGVTEHVDLHLGDVTQGIPVSNADAVILDVPNPWDAVEHAKRALKPGGFLAAYSPLVSQVEATRVALGRAGFTDARTLELIEREWHLGERGSRPAHDMLGHTAFLTFARRGPA